MAKKVVKKKKTEEPTEPDEVETDEEYEEDEEEEPKDDEEGEAEIAVDSGDGTYKIIAAPGGVKRALTVTIDGVVYQHVDEHEGRWAYRKLDPA